MPRRFQVIGADVMGDDDVDGDVMGEDEVQIVGYDPDTGYPMVVGARPRRRGRSRRHTVQVERPEWRDGQLAPGVIAPDQGLLPLPMGNLTFALASQNQTFSGQVQKPFKGERWLISVVRTGTSAVGRLLALMFVGTDLSALDITPVDLEQLANPQAFGVRTSLKPAQPGVFIRAVTSLSSALTGTDTIFASLTLLGKNIH